MTESEIVTNELIVEAIDKIVEKFQKKAIKEREKAKRAYVTYKGEIFFYRRRSYGCIFWRCFFRIYA